MKTTYDWPAYGIYLLVALAVLLPLFAPGFILTLDMVFTPSLPMPDSVTSSYLFHAGLHVLNLVIPSEIIQKLLLLSVLTLSGIGMHRLVRQVQPERSAEWGIYVASVFYMINPFTYSRFMAGQYAVLLGYALLPWFVRLLLGFIHRPGARTAIKLGGLTTLIGVVSIHTLGAVAVMTLVAIGIMLWRFRQKTAHYLRFGLIAAGIFVLLSSYWLVPLATGQGKTAETIHNFTSADMQAFATNGGSPIGRIGNIVRLQGFWAEDKGLYVLPQERATLWGLMALAIIGLAVTGAVLVWRRSQSLAIFFAATGLLAVVLAAGAIGPWAHDIPLLDGYREPHKMVAVLALSYSIFLAFGIDAALAWLRTKSDTAYSVGAVAALVLPVLFMRVMFWGYSGQLVPRHYPADWYTVNQRMQQDDTNFTALFLPWHQYMSFGFSGRIIASPAPAFFAKPTLASTDPELEGATSGVQRTRNQTVTAMLGRGKDGTNIGPELTKQNVKYILLAKDLDYQQYDFLRTQPQLKLIGDYRAMQLYQNQAWKGE